MCTLEIQETGVQVKPGGMERAEGFVGEFLVEFAAIASVSVQDDPASLAEGLKSGVGLPNTKVGTWRHDDVEDYFCVHRDGPAIMLELQPGHKYARVVVTVEHPQDVAAQIQQAVAGQ